MVQAASRLADLEEGRRQAWVRQQRDACDPPGRWRSQRSCDDLQAAPVRRETRTVRFASNARAILLKTGSVGVVPPASKRATADWVIPAAAASSTWLHLRATRSSRTAAPSSNANRADSYAS